MQSHASRYFLRGEMLHTRGQETTLAVTHRSRDKLAFLDLGWIQVRDHFVQTVGSQSGKGESLGDLLVLADATFAPHTRFPLHLHEEVEVLSIVLSGTLTHHEPDHSVEVPTHATQFMSARGGLTHAEGNETDEPVRMLQLWFRPNVLGGTAEYQVVGPHVLRPQLIRISPTNMRQDAVVSLARLAKKERLEVTAQEGRVLYAVCIDGEAKFESQRCSDGDGLVICEGSGSFETESGVTVVVVDIRGGSENLAK
jgi:redox-sensitive bicupin YhaK (pirin superfamily)